MFGKKQETKELEEQLRQSQSRVGELTSRMRNAKEKGRELSPYFESQIAAQSEMDKQLTKVVGYAHQSIANSEESQRSLEQLAVDLTGIRAMIEEEETMKKSLAEKIDNQNEELVSLLEEKRRNETPLKVLKQLKAGLEDDLERFQTVVSQMQDFSKQMGVLCLNSAIEAGRMGEAGQDFLGAAEQVRLYAGEYDKATGHAAGQLDALKERVRQLSDQIQEMNEHLQKEEDAFGQFAKQFDENEAVCVQLSENRFSDKIYLLSSEMRLLTQNQEGIRELQRNTLSEMENIGESFMDEQEARKELERVFDQMTEELTAD